MCQCFCRHRVAASIVAAAVAAASEYGTNGNLAAASKTLFNATTPNYHASGWLWPNACICISQRVKNILCGGKYQRAMQCRSHQRFARHWAFNTFFLFICLFVLLNKFFAGLSVYLWCASVTRRSSLCQLPLHWCEHTKKRMHAAMKLMTMMMHWLFSCDVTLFCVHFIYLYYLFIRVLLHFHSIWWSFWYATFNANGDHPASMQNNR